MTVKSNPGKRHSRVSGSRLGAGSQGQGGGRDTGVKGRVCALCLHLHLIFLGLLQSRFVSGPKPVKFQVVCPQKT